MFDWLFPDRVSILEREIKAMSEKVVLLVSAVAALAASVDRVLAKLAAAEAVPAELEAAVMAAVGQVNALQAKLDAVAPEPPPAVAPPA